MAEHPSHVAAGNGGEDESVQSPVGADPTWRLFVAVDPIPAVVERLREQVAPARALAPRARWASLDKLHLTLAFLGSRPASSAAPIGDALRGVARRHQPLTLEARGAGTFGGSKRPRVLWVGLEGEVEALAALRREVEETLMPFGYEPEDRPFRPHLTLARARDRRGDGELAAAAAALAALDGGTFTVSEVILYRSELSPQGARYTQVALAPLGT